MQHHHPVIVFDGDVNPTVIALIVFHLVALKRKLRLASSSRD